MNKPYLGSEKYIFVSYAHKDKDRVFPIIDRLSQQYRVWYDDGIHFGSEWDKDIVEKLEGCFIFIFMVSKNSVVSTNCADELSYAREKNKLFVNIVIDDFELPGSFMFRYGRYQMCLLYKYKNIDAMIADLAYRTEQMKEVEYTKESETSDTESDAYANQYLIMREKYRKELVKELKLKPTEPMVPGCYKFVKLCRFEFEKFPNPASTRDSLRMWTLLKNVYFNFSQLLELYKNHTKRSFLEKYIATMEKALPDINKAYMAFEKYFSFLKEKRKEHVIIQNDTPLCEAVKVALEELYKMMVPIIDAHIKKQGLID